MPTLNKDLVKLAVAAFLADRSAERLKGTGVRWDRELELTVPASNPDVWNSVADQLEGHLHTLTGDLWSLSFVRQAGRRRGHIAEVDPADVVCLFSGGADSLAGAIHAHSTLGTPPVLLSHWDFNKAAAVQAELVAKLSEIWGVPIEHHRIQMQRFAKQAGSRVAFDDEKSRRSRSFLFVALGLAAAAARGAELWICENGFTTVNPPLSPERGGSLSTRTTHPGFLDGLAATLNGIGLEASIKNPFEMKPKGVVLAEAAASLTHAQAENLFTASHSCGKPPRSGGFHSGWQCGVCFGCLVRRGAFVASGITDGTAYVETALRGQPNRDAFLTPTRRKEVQAVRYRLARGYGHKDILAMSLPARLDPDETLTMVQDGLQELDPVVNSIP